MLDNAAQKKQMNSSKKRYARFCLTESEREALRKKPSGKFLFGLLLIGISFVIGWPAVAAAGYAAYVLEKPEIALVGGPSIYLFSHLVWYVGMFMAGVESIPYMKIFPKWIIGWILGVNRSTKSDDEKDSSDETMHEF